MRVTRWKVMAGGLLLGAGGLMAVADGPPAVPGCQPLPPALLPPVVQAAARVPAEPPVSLPLPKPAGLPAMTLPAIPAASPSPVKAESAPPLLAIPAAPPAVPAPPMSLPVAALDPVPASPFTPVAAPAPAVPADRPSAAEKPLVESKKAPEPAPRAEASVAEKRLKVVLHMGDDRPRFEVRDGDEVYLKVVSDRVEVKSAADKGDAATMKAAGRVAFVTPGGDGTCDELAILPGSGQVVAAGNVAFRHTWGRSETTVSAERMTFRLNHAGPTAIQAGYTPVR